MTDQLTQKEKEEIAVLAADIAYQRFYSAVGESVTKKILWIIGATAFAAWLYFKEGKF